MTHQPLAPHTKFSSADPHKPVLKVLGLGGGGCNAVARMMELGMGGVDFIAANTDHQVLQTNPAPTKIQLGPKVTRGLGAGGDPRIGQAAAEESCREIAAALAGADMVFLTAGMGGGTGTGSIPIAAEISRSLGAVTIAVVTTPFSFEMGRRQRNASEGLAKLSKQTNTLISIPNDKILKEDYLKLPLETAFRVSDDLLRQAVQGISELITEPGMINVDFAHIRRLIRLGGGALMTIGHGEGDGKVMTAVKQALKHPLLDNISIDSAAGIIANFTGGCDLTLFEVQEALTHLQEEAGGQAEIVMGVTNDERMEDRAQVILVVTGLGGTLEEAFSSVQRKESHPAAAPAPAVVAEAPAVAPAPERIPQRRLVVDALSATAELAVPAPAPAPAAISPEMLAATQNLDMPAFLRRRARQAGLAPSPRPDWAAGD